MGTERKTIRLFADVQPGFDPFSVTWTSPAYASNMVPNEGSRRLWFEIEMPADHEVWPESFQAGVNLGRLNLEPGRRRIQVDGMGQPRPPEPQQEEEYVPPHPAPRPNRVRGREVNRPRPEPEPAEAAEW